MLKDFVLSIKRYNQDEKSSDLELRTHYRRVIKDDIIQAFDEAEELFQIYPEEHKISSSFIDFLFRICGVDIKHNKKLPVASTSSAASAADGHDDLRRELKKCQDKILKDKEDFEKQTEELQKCQDKCKKLTDDLQQCQTKLKQKTEELQKCRENIQTQADEHAAKIREQSNRIESSNQTLRQDSAQTNERRIKQLESEFKEINEEKDEKIKMLTKKWKVCEREKEKEINELKTKFDICEEKRESENEECVKKIRKLNEKLLKCQGEMEKNHMQLEIYKQGQLSTRLPTSGGDNHTFEMIQNINRNYASMFQFVAQLREHLIDLTYMYGIPRNIPEPAAADLPELNNTPPILPLTFPGSCLSNQTTTRQHLPSLPPVQPRLALPNLPHAAPRPPIPLSNTPSQPRPPIPLHNTLFQPSSIPLSNVAPFQSETPMSTPDSEQFALPAAQQPLALPAAQQSFALPAAQQPFALPAPPEHGQGAIPKPIHAVQNQTNIRTLNTIETQTDMEVDTLTSTPITTIRNQFDFSNISRINQPQGLFTQNYAAAAAAENDFIREIFTEGRMNTFLANVRSLAQNNLHIITTVEDIATILEHLTPIQTLENLIDFRQGSFEFLKENIARITNELKNAIFKLIFELKQCTETNILNQNRMEECIQHLNAVNPELELNINNFCRKLLEHLRKPLAIEYQNVDEYRREKSALTQTIRDLRSRLNEYENNNCLYNPGERMETSDEAANLQIVQRPEDNEEDLLEINNLQNRIHELEETHRRENDEHLIEMTDLRTRNGEQMTAINNLEALIAAMTDNYTECQTALNNINRRLQAVFDRVPSAQLNMENFDTNIFRYFRNRIVVQEVDEPALPIVLANDALPIEPASDALPIELPPPPPIPALPAPPPIEFNGTQIENLNLLIRNLNRARPDLNINAANFFNIAYDLMQHDDEIEQLQNRIQDVETELENSENERAELLRTQPGLVARIQNYEEIVRENNEVREADFEDLQRENEELLGRIQIFENMPRVSEEERERNEEIRRENIAYLARVRTLEDLLERHEQENFALQAQNDANLEEVRQLNAENANLITDDRGALENLRVRFLEATGTIENLRAQLVEAQETITNLRAQLVEAQETITNLEANNNQPEIQRLNATNEQNQQEIQRLRTTNEQNQQEIQNLHTTNEQNQQEMQNLRNTNEQIQQQIQNFATTTEQYQQQMQRLHDTNEQYQQEIQRLNNDVGRSQLVQQIEILNRTVNERDLSLENLQSQNLALRDRYEQLNRDKQVSDQHNIRISDENYEQYQRQIQNYVCKERKFIQTINDLNQTLSDRDYSFSELEMKCTELDTKYNKLRADHGETLETYRKFEENVLSNEQQIRDNCSYQLELMKSECDDKLQKKHTEMVERLNEKDQECRERLDKQTEEYKVFIEKKLEELESLRSFPAHTEYLQNQISQVQLLLEKVLEYHLRFTVQNRGRVLAMFQQENITNIQSLIQERINTLRDTTEIIASQFFLDYFNTSDTSRSIRDANFDDDRYIVMIREAEQRVQRYVNENIPPARHVSSSEAQTLEPYPKIKSDSFSKTISTQTLYDDSQEEAHVRNTIDSLLNQVESRAQPRGESRQDQKPSTSLQKTETLSCQSTDESFQKPSTSFQNSTILSDQSSDNVFEQVKRTSFQTPRTFSDKSTDSLQLGKDKKSCTSFKKPKTFSDKSTESLQAGKEKKSSTSFTKPKTFSNQSTDSKKSSTSFTKPKTFSNQSTDSLQPKDKKTECSNITKRKRMPSVDPTTETIEKRKRQLSKTPKKLKSKTLLAKEISGNESEMTDESKMASAKEISDNELEMDDELEIISDNESEMNNQDKCETESDDDL